MQPERVDSAFVHDRIAPDWLKYNLIDARIQESDMQAKSRAVRLTRSVLQGAMALLLTMGLATTARAQDLSYQAWGAVMTDNDFAELLRVRGITLLESGLIGLGVHRRFGPEYHTPFGSLRFEVEAHLVRHFGLQDHWEVNIPLGLRLTPERRILGIDSVAFGIGPSFASEIPAIELRRGSGIGSREMVYFHVEAAHELRAYPGTHVFFRVHHRSGGYGLIDGVGTNALAVGFRRLF